MTPARAWVAVSGVKVQWRRTAARRPTSGWGRIFISWHDIRFIILAGRSFFGDQMGEVVEFPKPDRDRDVARLIQQARALYESVFPTEKCPADVQQDTPART
jgi:hypothetical protein